jgi:hypothetical protein
MRRQIAREDKTGEKPRYRSEPLVETPKTTKGDAIKSANRMIKRILENPETGIIEKEGTLELAEKTATAELIEAIAKSMNTSEEDIEEYGRYKKDELRKIGVRVLEAIYERDQEQTLAQIKRCYEIEDLCNNGEHRELFDAFFSKLKKSEFLEIARKFIESKKPELALRVAGAIAIDEAEEIVWKASNGDEIFRLNILLNSAQRIGTYLCIVAIERACEKFDLWTNEKADIFGIVEVIDTVFEKQGF